MDDWSSSVVEDDNIDIGGRCGRYVMSTEEDGQGVSEEGGDAAALASLAWIVDDIAGIGSAHTEIRCTDASRKQPVEDGKEGPRGYKRRTRKSRYDKGAMRRSRRGLALAVEDGEDQKHGRLDTSALLKLSTIHS